MTHRLTEDIREAASKGFRPDQIATAFRVPEEQVRHVLNGGVLETGSAEMATNASQALVVVQKMVAGGPEVIAVHSVVPRAGKTFVSIHLAYALALKGVRVAILDADAENNGLSLLLPPSGPSNQVMGIRTLIEESDLSWRNLAYMHFATATGSVSIIPMYTLVPEEWPDPANAFTQIIQVARGEVDYLIVDAGRTQTQLSRDALAVATEVLEVMPLDASTEAELRRGLDRIVPDLAHHDVWAVINRFPRGYSDRMGSPDGICRELGINANRVVKIPDLPEANLFLQKSSRTILADHRVADSSEFRSAFEALVPASLSVPRDQRKKRLGLFGR